MLRPEDGCDRGQLLVIIALVLGIVFVALAIVVNAAIFTENLATRETVDSERTAAFTGDVERAIEVHYKQTNSNGFHTASDARETFDDTFRTWTDQRSNVSATEGGYYGASWTTHVGWRLDQSTDASFAPADKRDETEWTLATDVENIAAFELDVTKDDLHDSADGAFNVFVTDSDVTWELFVYRSDGNVVVTNDPATSDECIDGSSRVEIDVRAGKLNGNDCDELDLPASLDGTLEVKFRNVQAADETERVYGTYTVVVNGSDAVATDGDGEPTKFNRSGEAPPTAAAVVYAVNYTTTYERADVAHHRDPQPTGFHSARP
ncbi:hypothetical protein BRC75_10255 [Halobacteriales archaeon QH_7_69_31]|nr:MAG: hypothetical protein BRC75_10255 [Halobacteriales archaeon QH_7_69_31]